MSSFAPPSPDLDPGYLESLRSRSELSVVRREAALLALVPLVVFVLLPYLVREGGAPLWTLLPPALVAVASAVVARRATDYAVPPLSPGTEQADGRTASLAALRHATHVRLAVAAAPIAAGVVMALVGTGLLPYVVGFLLGWPQVLLALPRTARIEDVRSRLDAAGAQAPLWDALLRVPTHRPTGVVGLAWPAERRDR
jgi:hypothetical protein